MKKVIPVVMDLKATVIINVSLESNQQSEIAIDKVNQLVKIIVKDNEIKLVSINSDVNIDNIDSVGTYIDIK